MEDFKFCVWQFEKDFCKNFIVKVFLYPSYGMYPDKGKFENENFTDGKVTREIYILWKLYNK